MYNECDRVGECSVKLLSKPTDGGGEMLDVDGVRRMRVGGSKKQADGRVER